jgi:hypothetical protein
MKRRMSVSDAITELKETELVRKSEGKCVMSKSASKLQIEIVTELELL